MKPLLEQCIRTIGFIKRFKGKLAINMGYKRINAFNETF